jgi:hypothetical protein
MPRRKDVVNKDGKINLSCPDCGSEMVIDAATGEILFHKAAEKPLAGGKDFDALLAGVDSGKDKAAALFDRELSSLGDRDRLLDAKFEEAMERAKDEPEGTPPVRPWDLD